MNDNMVDDDMDEEEKERLKKFVHILKLSYNMAINDAAHLLNSVDLPREELAAAVRKLKK
jgi:hypothetical protein